MPNPAWRAWSREDSAKLLKLHTEAKGDRTNVRIRTDIWQQIAVHFPGRTLKAVRNHHANLMTLANGKSRGRYRVTNPKFVVRNPEDITLRQNPIALPPHATITAFVFGDPLPGRSALDQKRAAQL